MKVKVLKRKKIIERTGPTLSTNLNIQDYYRELKDFFNPKGKDYFFNKKLIFYDFETKGLLPSPYIHQFAALVYNPNQDGSVPNPEKPDDVYVAKCFFEPEISKAEDAIIYNKRKSYYTKSWQRGNVINRAYPRLISSMRKILGITYYNKKFRINTKKVLTTEEQFQVKGLFLLINELKEGKSNTFPAQLKSFLSRVEEKHEEVAKLPNFGFFKGFDRASWQGIRAKEIGYNLWNLITTIKNDYKVGSREKGYRESIQPIMKQYSYINGSVFNLTYRENYALTHVDNFPLRQFVDNLPQQTESEYQKDLTAQFGKRDKKAKRKQKSYAVDQEGNQYKFNLVSEKHALKGFLEFIEKQGDDAVLIGQNIIKFDNSVTISRAKHHNLDQTMLSAYNHFYDSYVYDTMTFFKHMIKLFEWYEREFALVYTALGGDQKEIDQFLDERFYEEFGEKTGFKVTEIPPDMKDLYPMADKEQIGSPLRESEEEQLELIATRDRVKELMDILRKKYPKPRAKLDGLMIMFQDQNQKPIQQTHAADDDCVQLARVFLENFNEVKEMVDFYYLMHQKLIDVKYKSPLAKKQSRVFNRSRSIDVGTDSKTKSHISKKMAEDIAWLIKDRKLGPNGSEVDFNARDYDKLDPKTKAKIGKVYDVELEHRQRDYIRLISQSILQVYMSEYQKNNPQKSLPSLINVLYMKSKEVKEQLWDKYRDKAHAYIDNNNKLKAAKDKILNWSVEKIMNKSIEQYYKDMGSEDLTEGKIINKSVKIKIFKETKRRTKK